MSDEVEKLWELQQVVSLLADRERQLTTRPESFAAVEGEYQAANAEMLRLQESLETMARERRKVDGELSDQQEILKKYQGQLMQVKNQQQYAAAWKEIDATRKHVKELEDAVLKSMGEADLVQKELDERKAGFDELKGRYDAAYDAWQASLGDLRAEADGLRQKQKQLEERLPDRLRREFARVLHQRHGIAVVKLDGETCSACRTRIRPALAQRLRRGEMVTCEGCNRILYMERPAS